jgi:hypothetical protein
MGQMSFLEKLLNGAEVEWKVLGEVYVRVMAIGTSQGQNENPPWQY